jgi:hypothetical protein
MSKCGRFCGEALVNFSSYAEQKAGGYFFSFLRPCLLNIILIIGKRNILIALLNSHLKKLIIFSNVIFKREFSRAKRKFSHNAVMLNGT